MRGDVDGSGIINIDDLAMLIDYMLTGNGEIDLVAADCDQNGVLNIDDVPLLIDYMLTGEW